MNFAQVNINEVETNTEIMESATYKVEVANIGVNTEILNHDGLLEVDKNVMIHPRDQNEKIVEMKINHNFKSWEEVRLFIMENL